jgi:hypothetical protein
MSAAVYVILKRGYYYRPHARGYTGILEEAGRFTEAVAMAERDNEPGAVSYHHQDVAPDFSEGCDAYTAAEYTRVKLAAANAALALLAKSHQTEVAVLRERLAMVQGGAA